MSWKQWAKITLFILIPLCLLLVLRSNEIKNDREQRIIAAEAKWERAQREAAAVGIYTDIDAYLEANSGEAPRLLDDFPFVHVALEDYQDGVISIFDIERAPDFNFLPQISSKMTHGEVIQEFKNSLATPPTSDATDKEIYQALLSALEPFSEDLEQWKSAVSEAKGLGKDYCNKESFIISSEPFRSCAELLLLRSYCHWSLGSTDASDLLCVINASDLLYEYGGSLMGLSIALACDFHTNDILILTIRNETIDNHFAASLVKSFQLYDAESLMRKALHIEYIVKLYAVNSMLSKSPHPLLPDEDPLRDIPLYQLVELRSDLSHFHKNFYLDKNSPDYHFDLLNISKSIEGKILNSTLQKLSQASILSSAYSIEGYQTSLVLNQALGLAQQIKAACLIYKRDFGAYPNSLANLTPKYLNSIPKVPYINSAYGYEKTSDHDGFPIISATIPLPNGDEFIIPEPNND